MRQLVMVVFVCSLMNPVLATDVTWTNDGGDGTWSNPQNWDTGTVPGSNDNVYVPEGSPTCMIDGDELGLITIASLENRGTIEYSGNTRILSSMGLENFGTISGNLDPLFLATETHITNWSILSGGSLECQCESFSNNDDADITFAGNGIRITAGMDVENYGDIGTSNGGDIHISCGSMNNWGYVKAGNGTLEGNPNGGSLHITAYPQSEQRSGSINHYSGGFMGAGTNMPTGMSAGLLALTATSIFIQGVLDTPPDRAAGVYDPEEPPRVERGDIVLISESMNIGSETARIHGAMVRFQGRNLTFYGPADYFMIRSVEDMYFATSADGTVDFTELHDSNAIRSVEEIFINSNTILEPTEGLNEICDPDPAVLEADTSLIATSVYCHAVRDSGGMPGTGEINLQNLGTGTSIFAYSITSTKGWLPVTSGSSDPLSPFESTVLEFPYLIPGGTTPGTQDTVVIVTSVNDAFSDTVYGTVLCVAEGLPADPALAEDLEISLRVSPNPFHANCTIATGYGHNPLSKVEIFDLSGRRITGANMVGEPLFVWEPDPSIQSGVFLVRAQSPMGAATRPIMYMR